MRVLIVEDEPHTAELIGRGLAKEGMAVTIASTGEEAVEMAAAADYDSIVLDVLLPGIDGFETCRRLRSGDVWSPVLTRSAPA
jgi:two-component system OmpR family response regulator